MGNIFSRPITKTDQLFEYEEKILKIESELINLKRNGIPYRLFLSIITIIPFCIVGGLNLYKTLFLTMLGGIIAYLLRIKYKNSCIRMAEYKLKMLKEEQSKLVQSAKEEEKFYKTRRLIEKYEAEKDRESFFSTVISKRRTGSTMLADMILANDPNKMNALICTFCGQHNGLIDTKNSDIKYFYCYDCRQKNIRDVDKQLPKITGQIDSDLDSILNDDQ